MNGIKNGAGELTDLSSNTSIEWMRGEINPLRLDFPIFPPPISRGFRDAWPTSLVSRGWIFGSKHDLRLQSLAGRKPAALATRVTSRDESRLLGTQLRLGEAHEEQRCLYPPPSESGVGPALTPIKKRAGHPVTCRLPVP